MELNTCGVVLHPGDTLVLAYDQRVSEAELAQMQEHFERLKAEKGIDVLIVEGVSQVAAIRSGRPQRIRLETAV